MRGRADGPEEVDAARCGAVGEGEGEEVSELGQVVRDARAGGEEDGCAVGGEGGWLGGVVGAFEEGGCLEVGIEGEGVGVGGSGAVVEVAGHALAGGDEEGDFGGCLCWWEW